MDDFKPWWLVVVHCTHVTLISSSNIWKYMKLDFSRWYTITNTSVLSNQSIHKVWSCYVQRFRRYIYKKEHYFTFDLRSRTLTFGQIHKLNVAQYHLHHMTYASAKFLVAMSNDLGGNAFTRNIWVELDLGPRSREVLPSTSCDLCTCKVWSCYCQWLRRCIYKKIHYFTFDLDPNVKGVKVTQNVAQYPLHHVTFAPAKFDVATSHG